MRSDRLVKAYFDTTPQLEALADLFDVSSRAMEIRLEELGLL